MHPVCAAVSLAVTAQNKPIPGCFRQSGWYYEEKGVIIHPGLPECFIRYPERRSDPVCFDQEWVQRVKSPKNP